MGRSAKSYDFLRPTLTLYLPFARDATTMRTLLIDDTSAVRRMLRHALAEIPGSDVVGEADTVSDAIAQLDALKPDLVILDLMLMDGTGLRVLEKVSRMSPPPHVIVFTNHAMPVVRARCLAAGAAHVYDKSRELDALVASVVELAGHTVTAS
jgi:DNA-binding NarL/FixJ family response regulator